MIESKSNTKIAKEFLITIHTINAHITIIFEKLSGHDRVQAIIIAIKEGLVE